MNFIQSLSNRLQLELPGYNAQQIMEPPMRGTFSTDHSNAKKAATLLGLYYDVEWKFLLIERSSHPLDKHKGQISFPGGSLEENETPELAAIREAQEEIGMPSNKIQLTGALTPLFIPVSNFMVYPFVGLLDMEEVELVKQESEVASILNISLAEFLNEDVVQKQDMVMGNGVKIANIPIYKLGSHTVWGATAMMLSEFRIICQEII